MSITIADRIKVYGIKCKYGILISSIYAMVMLILLFVFITMRDGESVEVIYSLSFYVVLCFYSSITTFALIIEYDIYSLLLCLLKLPLAILWISMSYTVIPKDIYATKILEIIRCLEIVFTYTSFTLLIHIIYKTRDIYDELEPEN